MFSSDSRWDRHTPEQSYYEDPIDVGAIFVKGRLLPQTFVWKQRKYIIKKVTYHWEESRGGQMLHYFTVTDHINLYYIYLNSRYMYWRLTKACPIE